MADIISYTSLFERLKVLIKYFNILEARQSSTGSANYPLPYIKNQIIDPFETLGLTNELATLESDFTAATNAIESLKLSVLSWFEAALAGIASELGVYNDISPAAVLTALADAMQRDAETVNAREMIVNTNDIGPDGTIKAHVSNTGAGKLVYTFVRPGLSPSEIANAEVLQCICTSATTLKQEVFQLSGEKKNSRVSHLGRGSGLGSTVTSLGASITNNSFESWTSNAADNWTAVLGAWNTEIVQDTSKYEGTYCVKTAYSEGDWKITHALPITLQPYTIYAIGLWAKKNTGATGTLRFGLSNGSAVDAFVAGCVKSVDVSALGTTYEFQFLAFKTPAVVDSSWTIGISSATPGGADFFFDLIQFGAMTAFNEMYFAIFSGSTGFGLNDKFGFGSDNVGFEIVENYPGVIQEFLGRCFSKQLPSATGGAETISDPS